MQPPRFGSAHSQRSRRGDLSRPPWPTSTQKTNRIPHKSVTRNSAWNRSPTMRSVRSCTCPPDMRPPQRPSISAFRGTRTTIDPPSEQTLLPFPLRRRRRRQHPHSHPDRNGPPSKRSRRDRNNANGSANRSLQPSVAVILATNTIHRSGRNWRTSASRIRNCLRATSC